jgi:hypothetical protein
MYAYNIRAEKSGKTYSLHIIASGLARAIELVQGEGYEEPKPEDITILKEYDDIITERR